MQYVTKKSDGCFTRENSNGNSDVMDGGGRRRKEDERKTER